MERAVSGHGAARSSRVGLTVAGAQQRPHRRACGKPTTAPRIESWNLYPQSIRLSCRLGRDKRHDRQIFVGVQRFYPIMQKEVLEEIRCRHCGKLLAKGQASVMEFKCPRCGAFTILRAERPCSESPDGQNGANRDKRLSA